MKIRIKTYNGELPSYLTVGKVYEVERLDSSKTRAVITHDDGEMIMTNLHKSGYLNGGSWGVVSE